MMLINRTNGRTKALYKIAKEYNNKRNTSSNPLKTGFSLNHI